MALESAQDPIPRGAVRTASRRRSIFWLVVLSGVGATVVVLFGLDVLVAGLGTMIPAQEGYLEDLVMALWILLLAGASGVGIAVRRRRPVLGDGLGRGSATVAGGLLLIWAAVWWLHRGVDAGLRELQESPSQTQSAKPPVVSDG